MCVYEDQTGTQLSVQNSNKCNSNCNKCSTRNTITTHDKTEGGGLKLAASYRKSGVRQMLSRW
jgi:hypothetical protein